MRQRSISLALFAFAILATVGAGGAGANPGDAVDPVTTPSSTPSHRSNTLGAGPALAAGQPTMSSVAAPRSVGVQAHVVSFDWSPAGGTLTPGQSADINVHFDQPVLVTGDPVIFLGVGGDLFADLSHYKSGSGTNTLTFRWTPKPPLHGPVSIRGIIDGIWDGNASIKDTEGANAEAHLVWDGNIYTSTGLIVDTAPTWVSSVDVPAGGTYRAGDNLDVHVHFSSAVTVSGPPRVNLFFDGAFRKAVYHSGSGTTDITFRYTVQPGDVDADGIGLGVVVFMNAGIEGGWISDGGGRVPDLNLFNVPSTSGVRVDAKAPAIGSLDVPAPGFYDVGDELDLVMHFDEDLVINLGGSTPVIFINLGGQPQEASYVSGSGSELTFRYTVQTGDYSDDGLRITGWLMRGARFWDAAGNEIDGTLNNIGDDSHVFVDTEAPRVIGVDVPLDGTYKTGDQLEFTVSFIEPVVVTGTPTIGLTVGAHPRSATYLSGTGTDSLVFRYTVEAGDLDTDGIDVGVLGGGITDPAGHAVQPGVGWWVPWTGSVLVGTAATPTPTPTPSEPTPAQKDTVPPSKPASPAANVKGGQLQLSSGGSTDNVKVVGYRLYRDGNTIATFGGSSFKLPVTLNKAGKLVLELRAFDAAGNESAPVVLTLTRKAHPKAPQVKPAWAWKLARWQDAPKATRGVRPHTPTTLPKWYGKWNAWHKAPVKVTVG